MNCSDHGCLNFILCSPSKYLVWYNTTTFDHPKIDLIHVCYKCHSTLRRSYVHVHDNTWDGKKEWKKERKTDIHLRQMKKMKMSCLRWDSNPRHSALHVHLYMYMYVQIYMYCKWLNRLINEHIYFMYMYMYNCTCIPYSRKYWRELCLAIHSKKAIGCI